MTRGDTIRPKMLRVSLGQYSSKLCVRNRSGYLKEGIIVMIKEIMNAHTLGSVDSWGSKVLPFHIIKRMPLLCQLFAIHYLQKTSVSHFLTPKKTHFDNKELESCVSKALCPYHNLSIIICWNPITSDLS